MRVCRPTVFPAAGTDRKPAGRACPAPTKHTTLPQKLQTKPAAHGACNPWAAVFYRIPVPSKSLYKLLDSVKSLRQVGDDVVDVLGADGQADRVAADAYIGKLRIGELAVGRGGRVDTRLLTSATLASREKICR